MTRPPAEVLHLIITSYVAGYVDETFGPHSRPTGEGGGGGGGEQAAFAVLPLLLTSYQFRQITLGILSQYSGVPLDESGERLETPPWPRTFDVYAVLSTQLKPGAVLTKAVSQTGSSPAVALCIFAKAALREIRRRRRMQNVSTLAPTGTPRWSDDQDMWENALRDALNACDTVPLSPPTTHALRQCAQDTLTKAILEKRYATLISALVGRLQHLCRLRTDVSTMQNERFVLWSLIHLLGVLNRADEETRDERTGEVRGPGMMPDTEDFADLCVLAQRVIDLDLPQSDGLTSCKALAGTLKGEWEQQLLRMRHDVRPAARSSDL
ncbi:hypothetical protein PsYK624_118190 [Phanerochaete sordida]|uniref:Uncharacterized protein n=1 Tax=Phanerochaete sordida TaxID=48140 RepID=A0A9P3GIN6_9APHY|nr:hypothetical protein PsYK624_118190 [Phanerochaete sordida]